MARKRGNKVTTNNRPNASSIAVVADEHHTGQLVPLLQMTLNTELWAFTVLLLLLLLLSLEPGECCYYCCN